MRAQIVIAITLVAGTACGGSDSPQAEEDTQTSGTEVVAERYPEAPPEPEPPAPSGIRVIHAAAGQSGDTFAGSAGPADAPSAQFDDLTFPVASVYIDVTPPAGAADVAFRFGAEGGASAEHTVELNPGVPTTLVLYTGADEGLAVLAMPDEASSVTGQLRGRFVNAMLGADSIDLCFPGESRRAAGRPIIAGVAYGEFGGIPSFPSRYQPMTLAGVESVQLREGNDAPCSGRIIGTVALPPIDPDVPHNLTIVAVGRRAGRPRARQLLICEDHPGPGTCAAIPMTR